MLSLVPRLHAQSTIGRSPTGLNLSHACVPLLFSLMKMETSPLRRSIGAGQIQRLFRSCSSRGREIRLATENTGKFTRQPLRMIYLSVSTLEAIRVPLQVPDGPLITLKTTAVCRKPSIPKSSVTPCKVYLTVSRR